LAKGGLGLKRRKIPVWVSPLVSALVLLSICAVFMIKLSNDEPTEESIQKLRDAISNAAVQCYSLEGAYPESIDYLEQHYGLAVDHNRFGVSYKVFGSNVRPEISIYTISKEYLTALNNGDTFEGDLP
jgi:hypothetical protein